MNKFQHVQTSLADEASVSADEWMAAVADWAEHVEFLKATAPLKIVKIAYPKGMQKGRYPLTRHVTIDKTGMSKEEAAAVPDTLSETLLWLDPAARMLLYQIDHEPWGMRNYFAFNEVEALGRDKCRVTISSRFNVPKDAPVDGYLTSFHASYKSMIAGIADYAKSKRKTA